MANSVDPDQTAPLGVVCSGSTLFASILNSSVMLGNHLRQTTSAIEFSDAFFFLGILRANWIIRTIPVELLLGFVLINRFGYSINPALRFLCEKINTLYRYIMTACEDMCDAISSYFCGSFYSIKPFRHFCLIT